MSYDALRTALTKMPATGEQGFEGLLGILLSALTGVRFYIARSGDQPADAVSSQANVAIQGKRYDKTRLNETEFEGDFHKACRLCPQLDCYILGVTRATGELKVLAEGLQNQTGIDILIIEFDGDNSELPCLCVSFWSEIQRFPAVSALDPSFGQWALQEAQRPSVQGMIQRLRLLLTESVPLASSVHRKLVLYLQKRFQIESCTPVR